MKNIAWCTPFSAASSISEFSHTLVESHNSDPLLSAQASIDVLVNENGRRYRSSSTCLGIREILGSRDALDLFTRHYDHVFYNLGNNKENHQEIFELSRAVPGVAILHDYVYQHYLAGRIFADHNAPKVYAYLMGRHYGAAGLSSVYASQILRDRDSRIGLWDTDLTSRFPLIEAIVANPMQRGVVVHSAMARRALAEVYDGPILQLRLPGDEKETPPDASCVRWRQDTARRERVTIALIGHIQRGKQIHRLIEAIFAAPRVADHVQSVIIAGKPSDGEYVEHLRRLVAGHPLGALVRLECNVSHERLQEIKEAADFFVNMRYPNTEGGSGSLIEQMACGKPVIVLDSGIFAEVDSGVIKLGSVDDTAALQDAVHALASSPELRIELGEQARAYAQRYLSRDYIRDIVDFSETIGLEKRRAARFDVHDILLYDAETRGPEPLFSWPLEAFAEFARILFQHHFEPGLVDYLVREAAHDPIGAYKRYSFARMLLSIFDHAARGEACKYWLFPTEPGFEECYVLSCLKEQHYQSLAAVLAPVEMPLLKRWTTLVRRFSAATAIERCALLLSVWKDAADDTPGAEAADFAARVKEDVPARFMEVAALVATLPDDGFAKLMLGEWRPLFDSRQYQRAHADLHATIHADHETLVKHYETHGREEGRAGRVSSQALMSMMKNG